MAELTPKTIAELPELATSTSIQGDEYYSVMDGSSSKKLPMSANFLLRTGVSLSSGDDLDDFLEPGTYYSNGLSGLLHKPADLSDSTIFKFIVLRSSSYSGVPRVWQIIYVMGYSCTEYRRYYGNNGWGDWIKFDPDALANGSLGGALTASNFTVASNSTSDSISLSRRAFLIVIGASSTARGVYLLYNYSSAATTTVTPIFEASNITVTGAAGSFTVANASNYGAYCLLLVY